MASFMYSVCLSARTASEIVESSNVGKSADLAIYGGHISGRRPLGVKINPLYQENDNGVNRDPDNQSGPSNSASEIQIEMYESLPRFSFVRSSVSVPNIFQANDTGLSRLPYVYNGHIAYLGDVEIKDEPRNFSDFSLPVPRGGVGPQSNEHAATERSESSVDSDKNKDHARPWSWPHSDRGYRKQLTRQSGIDATADEPDLELIETLPSTSGSSSTSSFASFENTHHMSHMKRQAVPRILTPKNFLRKKELSVLQEQCSVIENEQCKGPDDARSIIAVADVYSESSSTSVMCDRDDTSVGRVPCDGLETTPLETSEEICHTLSFTDRNEQTDNKLYSAYNEDNICVNTTFVNIPYPKVDLYKDVANIDQISCNLGTRPLDTSEDISHLLSFTDRNEQTENKLFSVYNEDTSFINKTIINISYPRFDSDTLTEGAT